MLFAGYRTSAELPLATPLDCCCNCGARGPIDLVETPLQRSRDTLFFGTELALREPFPYCAACRPTANRIRHGWTAKLLMAALATVALFLLEVMAESSMPPWVQHHLFGTAIVVASVATIVYFRLREARLRQRTYYQPVSLVDADLGDERLQKLRLRFSNAVYAKLFIQSNAALIAARILEVEIPGA